MSALRSAPSTHPVQSINRFWAWQPSFLFPASFSSPSDLQYTYPCSQCNFGPRFRPHNSLESIPNLSYSTAHEDQHLLTKSGLDRSRAESVKPATEVQTHRWTKRSAERFSRHEKKPSPSPGEIHPILHLAPHVYMCIIFGVTVNMTVTPNFKYAQNFGQSISNFAECEWHYETLWMHLQVWPDQCQPWKLQRSAHWNALLHRSFLSLSLQGGRNHQYVCGCSKRRLDHFCVCHTCASTFNTTSLLWVLLDLVAAFGSVAWNRSFLALLYHIAGFSTLRLN